MAGSAAGSVYDDWDGTPDCPDGVEGASSDETAVSCVGTCLDPDVLDNMPGDNSFDLDAFCPEVTFRRDCWVWVFSEGLIRGFVCARVWFRANGVVPPRMANVVGDAT